MPNKTTRTTLSITSTTSTNTDLSKYTPSKPGYRVVPLPIFDSMPMKYQPEDIRGYGFWWIDGKRTRCVLVEVHEEAASLILAEISRTRSEHRRECRCTVVSPKTGNPIQCPLKYSCAACPFKDYEILDDGADVPLDSLNEADSRIATSDRSHDVAMIRIEVREFIEAAQAEDETLSQIISLLQQKKTNAEVIQTLGLKKSRYYDTLLPRLEDLAEQYVNLQLCNICRRK